jgi:hypothetical protein
MKLIDPATGQAVWDSNDPYAGPVPPAPEGRQWVRVDEPGDTNAPRRTAPGILDIGNGVQERLAFLNQTFNPVEGIGSAMRAGSRMMEPDQSYWDRISALGEMASGVAGIAAPIAAARAIGVPAATAMMEGLLGGSPTTQAAGDMGRRFATDESGAFRLYQGSPYDFNAERLVRYPDGRTEYIVGRPDVLPDVPAGAEVLRNFPLGRQRMDKIGTGEGAQAYGYGLYGAEAEGIARSYRDALSRPYLATAGGQNIAEKYGSDVADIFEMAGGEPDDMRATVTRLRQIVKQNLDDVGVPDVSQLKSEFYGDLPSTIIDFSNRADRLENLLNSGDVKLVNEGKLYELNINANPEDFLDWDLPLSQQPKTVQDAFKPRIEALRKLGASIGNDPDGATLEQIAHPTVQLDDVDWNRGLRQQASDFMREAGVPGIRYLDAGSRSFTPTTIKDTPRGSELYWGNDPNPVDVFPTRQAAEEAAKQFDTRSRNYVVFDENLINIVRKYGIAGAAAMLGVSAVDVEEAIAQGMPPSQWDQLVVGPQ